MISGAAVSRRGSEDAVSRNIELGRRLRGLRNISVRPGLSDPATRRSWERLRGAPLAAIRTSQPTRSNLANERPWTPDLETVRQAQRGDALAWERLVRGYCRKVYRLCRRLLGSPDRAEDLTQEAFLRAFENLYRFDPAVGSFLGWLMRLARNLAIDDCRRERRHLTCLFTDQERGETAGLVFEAPDTSCPSPLDEIEKKERVALLGRALRRLPFPLREAVVLRDIQELSYEEIRDILQVPGGTVKSRINRGRIELARFVRQLSAQERVGLGQE
jgi:RNA polymerase sigma-70 factor (ECF subfamily)